MKKKLLFASTLIVAGIITMETYHSAQAFEAGAPEGVSGSPADNKNCTMCHGGTATLQQGLISSDIPANGYTPGQTYTITAKLTAADKSKFGFEVSPHAASGKAGTLIVTNSNETQLKGSGKYITHTSAGTDGAGSKTWTFNWTAPAAGSGTVTFYGAFNLSNNDGQKTGDAIVTSSLAIGEKTTGIHDNEVKVENVSLYPNPAAEDVTVNYSLNGTEKIEIRLLDVQGKVVKQLLAEVKNPGEHKDRFNIGSCAPGHYFVQVKTEKSAVLKKIIVQ